MFKKYLIFILIAVSFIAGSVALAQNIGIGTAEDIAKQGGLVTIGVTDVTISETIGRYISIALSFTGFIFLLLTLYAGYLWMFGGGNEENIDKAKKIFSSSIVGLVIVILAYSITALIMHYVVGTAAPEPYGETTPDGPSSYSGCCFVKKEPEKENECWQNIGERNCKDEKHGVPFSETCAKMMNEYGYSCEYQL